MLNPLMLSVAGESSVVSLVKAIVQERRTGQHAAYKERVSSDIAYHAEDGSWDAHKDSFS